MGDLKSRYQNALLQIHIRVQIAKLNLRIQEYSLMMIRMVALLWKLPPKTFKDFLEGKITSDNILSSSSVNGKSILKDTLISQLKILSSGSAVRRCDLDNFGVPINCTVEMLWFIGPYSKVALFHLN